jgi:hypothetical protein
VVILFLAAGTVLPRTSQAETVTGRVTFVGTLGEERQPDGSVQARFRFRLSESSCGTTEGVWTRSGDGSTWTAWERLPAGTITSDPVAVVRGSEIGVFARGLDGRIYGTSWKGTRWLPWDPIGNEFFSSGPAVASWSATRVDLFARGMTDAALWTNVWTGTWSGWRQLRPEAITSDPAAVSWGPNRIDVFARGTDNQVYRLVMNGNQWATSWVSMGGETFSSGPGVASYAVGQLSLFARGMDNALYSNFHTGTGTAAAWSGWAQVAPQAIGSDPAATSRGVLTVDAYALGTDDMVYRNARSIVSGWTGWTLLGSERFGSGPGAVTFNGRVHLFARGRPRIDRWYHVTSGRIDGTDPHNASNLRNAYGTLLSGFLARSVSNAQIDGVPGCDDFHTFALERAQIGLYP